MAADTATAVSAQIGATEAPAAPEAPNVREKYNAEREKRIREDGEKQFIFLAEAQSDRIRKLLEDPWVEPGTPMNIPVSDGGHTKFLIVGTGYGGIMYAVKLIQAGFNVNDIVFVDPAGGFGGTWYWNRYPGLMCDVESYIYMPFLEEMGYMPKRKYAGGEELRTYIESICRKYDLYKRAMFQSVVKRMVWNEETNEWSFDIALKPKGGEVSSFKLRSDYVFIATGVLHNSKLPDLPGVDTFKGDVFHTSRWRYDITGGTSADPQLTALKGKKVGIVGTGATAVQVVPELAKWADQLMIFQRTPSAVDARDNRDTDPIEWKTKIATKPGWQRQRNDNFNAFMNNHAQKPEVNMVDDGWTRAPAYSALIGGPYEDFTADKMQSHVDMLYDIDNPRQDRVRKRAEEIVQDKQTAESLQAWYPTWCKRPCFHDDYLKTFNLPNVKLIDTKGKGLDGVKPEGIVFDGKLYDLDVLVWSTGFQATGSPAASAYIDVTGRHGKSFEHEFKNNYSTLHGVCTRDFPNLFWPGARQSGVTANFSFMLDISTGLVAYMIAEAARRVGPGHKAIIEPTAKAQEAWTQRCMARGAMFAAIGGCTPSYLNGEAAGTRMTSEEMMKAARGSVWGHGITSYIEYLDGWKASGKMEGIEVTAA